MKIRHAKILFCGPSGVGKSSFVRFLKGENFISVPNSTGVGSIQQIMLFKKASLQGTKWVNLNLPKEIEQLRLRLRHSIVSNFVSITKEDRQRPVEQVEFDAENNGGAADHESIMQKECSPSIPLSQNIWHNNIGNVEKRLCTLSPTLTKDCEKPPPIWDVLTLLDTGGQPQFINMLPAVNTSATVTFVVLNMLNGVAGFDNRVLVHHYKKGKKSYEPYYLNYTNKDLINCLVALLKDSVLTDSQLPAVIISEKAKDCKPGLCFVGTHLDKVRQEDVDKINDKVEKLIAQLEPNDNISIWKRDGILFSVDNTTAGREDGSYDSTASDICCEVKRVIDNKAVYEVPIAWIILELEIRQMCIKEKRCYVEVHDVINLYRGIMLHLSEEDVEKETRAALKFHHKFGVFHDVLGMDNYVISSIQWLFTNLTEIVGFSFNGQIVNQDLQKFESKGVLSRSLIQKINIKSLEGIKLEHFFELLKKLKIATPFPKHDSSDYLMLTVLDSYKQEENDLLSCNTFGSIEGTPVAVQYESGSFPRGIFSCLIVQLIQDKYEKWKLLDSLCDHRCIFANMAVFCTSGYYIIFNDKVSYLEIHIRKSEFCDKDFKVHFEVLRSATKALLKVFSAPCLKFGFFCNNKSCLKPLMCLNVEHILESKAVPTTTLCKRHGIVNLELHRKWYQDPGVYYSILFNYINFISAINLLILSKEGIIYSSYGCTDFC